uniref:Uncharacterized protein n=1 Tax=Meloidogyne floridensis TaxID=298350 RepID=A0A915P9D1_9BILA
MLTVELAVTNEFDPKSLLSECSRNNTVEHENFLKNIFVHKKNKNLKSKQAVWELLAKYLVPLPRWKRQEVVLNTCRDLNVIASETCRNENCIDKEENHNEELTKCLNGLFFGEKNAGFAGINKGAKDKLYKKAAKIFINMIEEKPKVLGKLLFEQIESRNPDLKLIYEILFARPRHEIKTIIRNNNKYYPFMEAVNKIYNKYPNLLLEDNNSDNNSDKPLLEKHLKLKKKLNKNKGMKQVYELLIKRIDAINKGIGIVDEVEMNELYTSIVTQFKESKSEEKEMSGLTNLIENLLTKFQFKSLAALKFGEKFQKEENRNNHPLFNYELKIQKTGNFFSKIFSKNKNQKPSEGTHQKPSEDTHQKEKRPREFNKFYWEQLKEIMLISGLTEDKTNYNKRIEKEFDEINKNGNYKELINFLTLHADEDMSEILANYPKENEEKYLKNFLVPLKGKTHFFLAYSSILNKMRESDCYSNTENENSFEERFQQFRLEKKLKYMHLNKLYKSLPGKMLLRTSSKEKNKNSVTFSKLEPNTKEKIEKSIRESLYEKPHSEMIKFNFEKVKNKYLALFPNDTACEILKEFIKLEIRKFIERLRMFQREIPSNIEDMPDSEIKKKYFYDEDKGLNKRINIIVDKVVDKIDIIDEVKINKNYAEESEETISASAPANSPPDTPHELNNDKDLKEANENGKLK